ncbi:MAG: hypothetical protein ACLFQ5_12090, partial [Oceanicaulis sp.]
RRLAGDPRRLTREILQGYPASGDWYNVMPAYAGGRYDDAELAAILSYSRQRFVSQGLVSEATVGRMRERVKR